MEHQKIKNGIGKVMKIVVVVVIVFVALIGVGVYGSTLSISATTTSMITNSARSSTFTSSLLSSPSSISSSLTSNYSNKLYMGNLTESTCSGQNIVGGCFVSHVYDNGVVIATAWIAAPYTTSTNQITYEAGFALNTTSDVLISGFGFTADSTITIDFSTGSLLGQVGMAGSSPYAEEYTPYTPVSSGDLEQYFEVNSTVGWSLSLGFSVIQNGVNLSPFAVVCTYSACISQISLPYSTTLSETTITAISG